MTATAKSTVSLMALFVLGLALACDAGADTRNEDRYTDEGIQACVAEIGKRVSYEDASRVVHYVTKLNQRNLVEMEIRVETEVHLKGTEDTVREYTASCVTGAMSDLVRFRIDASA